MGWEENQNAGDKKNDMKSYTTENEMVLCWLFNVVTQARNIKETWIIVPGRAIIGTRWW